MGLTLWLPESARDLATEPRLIYECKLCGLKLPRPAQREQFQRHVRACAKKHRDKIEAEVARQNGNAFTGLLDPERHDWLRARQDEGLKKIDWWRDGVVR